MCSIWIEGGLAHPRYDDHKNSGVVTQHLTDIQPLQFDLFAQEGSKIPSCSFLKCNPKSDYLSFSSYLSLSLSSPPATKTIDRTDPKSLVFPDSHPHLTSPHSISPQGYGSAFGVKDTPCVYWRDYFDEFIIKLHTNSRKEYKAEEVSLELMGRITVLRKYIFGLIWRCYGPKRGILDYWGTIIFCLLSYYILSKDIGL